jgi:hypothetical protein
MSIIRVDNVEEAVRLAEKSKQSGKYDWFRGQTKDWPVRSSFVRLKDEASQEAALDKLGRFESWVKSTPGLEHLASDTDATIAVAQHYGLPTNFVDFTTEPRTAGFFASQMQGQAGDWGCIICLSTKDLSEFWAGMPSRFSPPEFLRLSVPDLWRLEAQHGCFLFCPYDDIEGLYDFDRILFPNVAPLPGIDPEDIYPKRKSNLEILLDQFFMNERLGQGERRMRQLRITDIQFAQPGEGCDPDVFPRGLPEHPSWSAAALEPWTAPPAESFFASKTALQPKLSVNVAASLASVAAGVQAQILHDLAEIADMRSQQIGWTIDFSDRHALPAELPALLSERLARLWDGLRRLPHSDDDIAFGLGMGVAFALALRGDFSNYDASHWEEAVDRCLQDAVELEFGAGDGSYSRGFVSAGSLRAAVREDIRSYISPEWQEEVLGNPRGIIQTAWDPRRVFDFERLAPVFAREIAPCQVLARSHAIFFSPARLDSLSLT